jgi:thiamine pyrophosphate-dependent acetolactate synthase large subunit-like protein
VRVEVPQKVPEMLAYAYREANTGRKGPVYVELPNDVMAEQIDATAVRWPEPQGAPARSAVPEQDVLRIIELLRSAERPLVLAGSGVLWAGANEELTAFIDRSGIPLVTTPQSRGVVPEDHPLVLTSARSRAQREADVVLSIGTRANWINGHLQPPRFSPDTRFIVVNADPDEIGRGRTPVIGVAADARTALRQLCDHLDRASNVSSWAEALIARDAAQGPSEHSTSSAIPIHPERLCAEIRRVLPRDAVFIVDGFETLEFGRRAIPSLSEANYLTAGPNGCMGVGVPFALGAKVACPDRPVFVLMGDGGFGWHGMEFDTLIRHSLPVVAIVFNNAGFTARPTAQGTGRELGYQRYDLMVAGFGGYGEFVEHPEHIAPALQRAIESGKPALVNVCVDPDIPATGGLLGALKTR